MHEHFTDTEPSSGANLPHAVNRRGGHDLDALGAFDEFKRRLADRLGPDAYASWGADLRVAEVNARRVRIAARSAMHRARLNDMVGERALKKLWAECDGAKRSLYLTDDPANAKESAAAAQSAAGPSVGALARPGAPVGMVERSATTLENFVVGDANRFAYTVMRDFAQADSPVRIAYVYGDYGVGKSHLLAGAAAAINAGRSGSAVMFTGPRWVHEYVKAYQGKSLLAFQQYVRAGGVLIVDDVHLIGRNAKASHDELSGAVSDVLAAGGRVLFAGAGPRESLTNLDAGLAARLSGAVDCPIGRPDLDLRRGVLEQIAARHTSVRGGLDVPHDVLDFIASAITTTPRDLEGGFNTVLARTVMMGAPLTREAARDALAATVASMNRRVTVEQIQKTVASFHGLTVDELLSKSRARDIVRPRQEAMFLSREFTTRSYPDIGERFGGMDHTTVLHAVRRVRHLVQEDATVRADVTKLRQMLNERRAVGV